MLIKDSTTNFIEEHCLSVISVTGMLLPPLNIVVACLTICFIGKTAKVTIYQMKCNNKDARFSQYRISTILFSFINIVFSFNILFLSSRGDIVNS